MTYTIRKGRHYSGSYWDMLIRAIRGAFKGDGMEFSFSFSKECLTPSPEPEDINKLAGFSVGRDHHQESARIGWRPNGSVIDLFAYVYHKGQRLKPTFICSVQPGTSYNAWLYLWDVGYHFHVFGSNQKLISDLYMEPVAGWDLTATKHMLYPYHGGTYPAQVTMTINLTRTA